GRKMLSAPERGDPETAKQDLAKRISTDGVRVLGQEKAQQYAKLRKELETLKKQSVPADRCLGVTEAGPTPPETFVLLRGHPQTKGPGVERGSPQVLSQGAPPPAAPTATSTGRRLVLARWLTSRDNPLTPRVTVNRLWQYHFGRGIVRSPNNFG